MTYPSYHYEDWSISYAQAPHLDAAPVKNLNDNKTDVVFVQHFLPCIDPDVDNMFDISLFSEETMTCIHPKAIYSCTG
jgi:hypothetical protein